MADKPGMKIEWIPIEQCNPAPYNPRVDLKPGDPQYEKIKRSIATFGLVEPVVWNKRTGTLVGGHQRLKIIAAQGVKDVPAIVVDLDLQQEKMLNISLNKVAGDWDFIALRDLLVDIDDGHVDLTLTGFDIDELKKMIDWDPPPSAVESLPDEGAPREIKCPKCGFEFVARSGGNTNEH